VALTYCSGGGHRSDFCGEYGSVTGREQKSNVLVADMTSTSTGDLFLMVDKGRMFVVDRR